MTAPKLRKVRHAGRTVLNSRGHILSEYEAKGEKSNLQERADEYIERGPHVI